MNEIFAQIVQALGVSSVSISDGTTNNVRTSSGEVAELLDVDETSYKYWMDFEIVGNKFTIVRVTDPSTGNVEEVEYTVEAGSDGTCLVLWDGGSETVKGTVSSGVFKYQWEAATGFYNYDPPADYLDDNGAVQ